MADILLREITSEDLEMIRTWRNSKEVSDYMYTDEYISEQQQKEWFRNINHAKSRYWIIEYEGKKLGLASLSEINLTLSSCYWAFYLGDLSVRGAGIGAKVEYNVLQYVFEELKLNKLRCEVFTFNHAVISMHEKFGFRREAYYREHCKKNEKFEDVVGLAILKKEWDQLKDGLKKRVYGE